MALGGDDIFRIRIHKVVFIEEQVKIFASFCKKKATHSILKLERCYIFDLGISVLDSRNILGMARRQ
jgi:hypothetical protein